MSSTHNVGAMPYADWQQALLAQDDAIPEGLGSWNGSDPAQRFAIYRNNVQHSLLCALADTYPLLRRSLGSGFAALAREFVCARPPRSALLALYGADFPAFLQQQGALAPWQLELADLEWRYVCSFHGPDARPLQPAQWQALLANPAQLAAYRPRLHPASSLLSYRHAILSCWADAQQADNTAQQAENRVQQVDEVAQQDVEAGVPLPLPAAHPEQGVLCRIAGTNGIEQVALVRLPPESITGLGALAQGASLLEALQQAAAEAPAGWQATTLLAQWLELGLLCPPSDGQ